MKRNLILHILIAILCLTTAAFSQDVAEISAEKKEVIAEIIKVTKAEEKVKETMLSFLLQMDAMYPSIIRSTVNNREDLSEKKKEELINSLVSDRENFNMRFRGRFLEAINFQQFVADTMYPLYDKFFTVSELKDLVEFYKSPTGQKFNEISPDFTKEAVRLTQILLLPKINEIMLEIVKNHTKKIKNNHHRPRRKAQVGNLK